MKLVLAAHAHTYYLLLYSSVRSHHHRQVMRLARWLAFVLEDEFYWKPEHSSRASGRSQQERQRALLKHVSQLCRFNTEALPVVERFVFTYLKRWNGSCNTELLLSIIETLHPCAYEDLCGNVLLPLSRLYLNSDVKFKVST